MNGSLVDLTIAGPVATITLNRPERHNSLIPALLEQLASVLSAAERQPEVAAVVLAARGKSFSTGGDVGEFYARRAQLAEYADRIVGQLNDVMLIMMGSRLPIVAAIHGIVTGGSLGLVLASDVVLVSPNASFAPWYTEVGFSPDGGWTALLPDVIGSTRTAGVLLQNTTITARDAVKWGLAAHLVATEDLAEEADRVAAAIAARRLLATASAKRLARGDLDRIATALEAERTAFITQIVTAEALRGMERFLGVTPGG